MSKIYIFLNIFKRFFYFTFPQIGFFDHSNVFCHQILFTTREVCHFLVRDKKKRGGENDTWDCFWKLSQCHDITRKKPSKLIKRKQHYVQPNMRLNIPKSSYLDTRFKHAITKYDNKKTTHKNMLSQLRSNHVVTKYDTRYKRHVIKI